MMRPEGITPVRPVSGGHLFLILNYVLGFALGQFATGSILGGLIVAAAAPLFSLLALALLLPPKDEVRRA